MKHTIKVYVCTFSAISIFLLIVYVLAFFILFNQSKNSTYEYAGFLRERMSIYCGIAMGLEFIFILIGMIGFTKFDPDCFSKWMLIVWFCYLILVIGYGIFNLAIHYADIKYEDYMIYTGNFEKDHTREFIFLDDKSRTRLTNSNETFLETGNYYGEVVYSKRTKCVLHYSLDTQIQADVASP